MYLTLPAARRWRQPQGPARIDSRYAAGIAELSFQKTSLLDGSAWSTFGTAPTYTAGPLGVCVDTTAAFGGLYRTPRINCAAAEQTHLFFGEVTAYSGDYAGIIACASGDGSAGSLSIQKRPGAAGWDVFTGGSQLPLSGNDRLTGAGVFGLVLTAKGGVLSVYLNGGLWGSVAAAPVTQATCRLVTHGARDSSSTYSTKGRCYLRGAWARGMLPDEALALSVNPLSLFAPDPIRTYFDLSQSAYREAERPKKPVAPAIIRSSGRMSRLVSELYRYNPAFLYAPDTRRAPIDLVTGVVGSGPTMGLGGIAVPTKNGDAYVTFPTNCGLGASNDFVFGVVLSCSEPPSSIGGAVVRIGGETDGVAAGFGNTSLDDSGGYLILMSNASVKKVSALQAIASPGFYLFFVYHSSENFLLVANYNLSQGAGMSAFEFTGTYSAPSSLISINGCAPSRGSNVVVHCAALFKGTRNVTQTSAFVSTIIPVFRTAFGGGVSGAGVQAGLIDLHMPRHHSPPVTLSRPKGTMRPTVML